jgi:hypothetical protein
LLGLDYFTPYDNCKVVNDDDEQSINKEEFEKIKPYL